MDTARGGTGKSWGKVSGFAWVIDQMEGVKVEKAYSGWGLYTIDFLFYVIIYNIICYIIYVRVYNGKLTTILSFIYSISIY